MRQALLLVPSIVTAYVCGPVLSGKVIGADHNLAAYSNISDPSECCSLCGNSEGCEAWNLHTSPESDFYHRCNLHSSSASSSYRNSSDSLAGVVTGASGCMTHNGGFWGSGSDVGPTRVVAAAPMCCAACRANPECKSFVWHSDTKQCWQHGSTDGYTPSSAAVGGVPSGPLPPKPIDPGTYVEGFACRDAGASTKYRFCDASLPLEARLDDLVNRIADDEAGHQLTARQSQNISRLGLPRYYWGTNAIHGVQNVQCINATCPTSFPAPNALAAAWNMTHVKEMGRIIGQELRAYFNLKIHNSLDTWSPTININRDPRWGRNVECGGGEDPMLAGLYGSAYTEGLQRLQDEAAQGELQAVVTLKHWLAYSIENYNGVTRTNVDVNVTAYDLADTYLPGWKACVTKGGALGVMCSYNMVNGKPTCANAALNKTLRSTWGFQGYVTSDSDSCACIYQPHAYAPSAEAAARDCLAGGTDIDSGATYLKNVAPALNDSTIASRATVDLALRNTYRLRMRLGLFEPHRDNDYRKFGLADVGAADSLAESLAASRQTMTLLKNDGATLPFKAGSAIAVVGQAVNDTVSFLTGNYNGPMNKSQVASIYGEVARLNAGGRTWSPPGIDGASVAAACAGADAIVLVVDNAHDGGTEGQDRYNITLSAAQISLATAVLALKIPTALVLVNGGAISIDDLADSAPAILEAWMPGTQGGTAIAETVLGLNNPGGKLPVTIYRSSYVDSADFLSMDIAEGQGRTYRYYKGATPMWRFGFGLSYTTFALKWTPPQPPAAAPPPRTLRSATDTTVYTVDVTNTGAVAGDEVVQAYFVPSPGIATRMGAPTPIKQLFDFQRVHLAAGASVTLKFVLNATSLAMADVDGHVSVHSDDRYRVVFSRGHGEQLEAPLAVALPERGGATRVETFERWW